MRWMLLLMPLMAADCLDAVSTPGGSGGWTVSSHGCFGNRTDAVWFDDANVGFVGCGTTTEGAGLYQTTDGGRTWGLIPSLATFRVDSLQRVGSGPLLVGGIGSNNDRVVALADDGSVTTLFASDGTINTSFTVGTYRETPSGRAAAESLNGTDVVYRDAAGAPFTNVGAWWGDIDGVQILDMEVLGDGFVGVGSRISQPPYIFLPGPSGDFALEPLVLDDRVRGELWSVDTDGTTVVVGGVDQDRAVGLLAVASASAMGAASDWTITTLDEWWTPESQSTWVRGVCVQGDVIMAVGELSRQGDGIALRSTDRGATFVDVTPVAAPPLSQCTFKDDGTVVVVGAEGFVAWR